MLINAKKNHNWFDKSASKSQFSSINMFKNSKIICATNYATVVKLTDDYFTFKFN